MRFMHPKVAIALSKDERKDPVVTHMYFDTMYRALKEAGFNCDDKYNLKDINKSKDFLIVGSCKVAFEYWIKGYKNLIIWIQGVVPEESIMLGYHKYKYYAHSFLEEIMIKKAKFIFMVSEEMLRHYENKYGLRIENKTFIMPCYNENKVDKLAFQNRKKYKNNTFLYAGSLQEWQCFNETVKVYKSFETQLTNTKLFVYTKDKKKAKEIIEKNNIQNYSVDFVSLDELSKKIRNIKYGFVLRKDSIVNRVATPTKISNYISHGIIPIYSPCLKSFDNYSKEKKMAISFDLEKIDIDTKRAIKQINQEIDIPEVKEWCEYTFNTYYNQDKYITNAARKIESEMNLKKS